MRPSIMTSYSYTPEYDESHDDMWEDSSPRLNTTSFYEENDELNSSDIESMLYSQIYFEQSEPNDGPADSRNTPQLAPSCPEIHVEDVQNLPQNLRHTSSVSSMLNFSARSFMSPECKDALKKVSDINSLDASFEIVDVDVLAPGSCSPKVPVEISSSSSDEVNIIYCSEDVKDAKAIEKTLMKSAPSKVGSTLSKVSKSQKKSKEIEKVVVMSDSDCVSKKVSKCSKAKKRKSAEKPDRVLDTAGKKRFKETPVIIDSSDSEDSLVVLGDSGVFDDSQDIQTNVTGAPQQRRERFVPDIITQSCDWRNIQLEHWDGKPYLDIAQVLSLLKPGTWNLDAADRYKTPKSRYFLEKNKQCRNCNEKGHIERECKKPKKKLACLYCGERGHLANNCPSSLCYNCDLPGHYSSQCEKPRRSFSVSCRRCQCVGHMKHECPENWRQYHLTTSEGRLVGNERKERRSQYCYNCGEAGHFGHECEEPGIDKYWNPMPPFVTFYEHQGNNTSQRLPVPDKSPHPGTISRQQDNRKTGSNCFLDKCKDKLQTKRNRWKRKLDKLQKLGHEEDRGFKKPAMKQPNPPKSSVTPPMKGSVTPQMKKKKKKGTFSTVDHQCNDTPHPEPGVKKGKKKKQKKSKLTNVVMTTSPQLNYASHKNKKTLKPFRGTKTIRLTSVSPQPNHKPLKNKSPNHPHGTKKVTPKTGKNQRKSKQPAVNPNFAPRTVFDREVANFPRGSATGNNGNKTKKREKKRKKNSFQLDQGFNSMMWF